MADAAVLPPTSLAASRGATILAGYLASAGAFHAWTTEEWGRARAWPNVGWLLPIAVYARGERDPAGAARAHAAEARAIGAPTGSVVVLDVEQADAPAAELAGFPHAWAEELVAQHFAPWVYCSLSSAQVAAGLPRWVAHWTNAPHLEPGSVATQWASPTSDATLSMDLSEVDPIALRSLWSLRNPEEHPVPELAAPVVAIVDLPQGQGYWIVAADGGVFAFGNAPHLEGPSRAHLAAAIVDATASPTGKGLYLVAGDGGVFGLGDAHFHGSIPGLGIGPAPGTAGDPTP